MQKYRRADVQARDIFHDVLELYVFQINKQILSHFREFIMPLCPKMFSGGFFDKFEHSSGYMRSGPDVVGI